MTYIPTLADTPPLKPLPKKGGYIPTRADTDQFSPRIAREDYAENPKHGFGYNVAAGLVNPFINVANLAPEAVEGVGHLMGAKNFHVPRIPDMPQAGGLGYDIGNIAGFALPFGAAAKGIEGGMALAKGVPAIAKALEAARAVKGVPMASRLATSAAAGAATGAATAPENEREGGAIGGGIGAPVGEALFAGAGKALSPSLRHAQEIVGGAFNPIHDFFNDSIQRVMSQKSGMPLKNAYHATKGKVDWDGLMDLAEKADNGGKFNALPYAEELKKVTEEATEQEKKSPGVSKSLLLKLKKLDQPVEGYGHAVDLRQNINDLADWDKARMEKENTLARHYSGRLGEALDNSVASSIKSSPKEKVNEAQDFAKEWKNQRAIYKKLQDFYANPKTRRFSQPMRDKLENGDFESALNDYVPNAQEGHGKTLRLGNLLDSSKDAEDSILQKGLSPYLDKEGKLDTLRLATGINKQKLSPTVVSLLNDDEKNALSQIIKSKDMQQYLRKTPTVLQKMARHPLMSAGALGTIAHFAKMPLDIVAGLSGAGYFGPQVAEKNISRLAARKAERMIDEGQWDKLASLGKETKKAQSKLLGVGSMAGGALGQQAGIE